MVDEQGAAGSRDSRRTDPRERGFIANAAALIS
jgi:hypothetical protein